MPRTKKNVIVELTKQGKVASTLKKYQNRPSPPFPANENCGKILPGNDGNMYESRANKNGVCAWKLVSDPTQKAATKKRSPKPRKVGTTLKKYLDRPSPPFPANDYCGQTLPGNDGNMYESRANKNGVCAWKKVN